VVSEMDKNYLESKLEEESKIRVALQSQVKELTKEKLKMEKLMEKNGARMSKED